MNNLRRFDNDLFPMAELLSRLDDGFRPFDPFLTWNRRHDTVDSSFSLSVGRGWSKDALNLRITMPAIGEKNFSLQVQGSMLILRGERPAPADFGEEGAVAFALPYGRFERVIELPDGLNTSKMKANLHHGVLDIKIPYLAEAKVRAVPVLVDQELPMAATA
ncbi:MAG: Hsp20/alpha crystallin family protein [Acidobacteriota bacterium]